MLLTPCELAVRDILPAVRALIVIKLKDKGYKQKEIAELLSLTQPAVSYYLNKRRAKKILLLQNNEKVMEEIDRFVERIISENLDQGEISKEFCYMCNLTRSLVFDQEKLKVFENTNCNPHH